MTIERALELLPQMRDSEWITALGQKTALYTNEAKEAFNMAISALEKQSVDKCCETCKYELLELDAYPCCDCIRAKDYYEPHTEEEE